MINQIMKVSVNKLKVFNVTRLLQSLVLLKEHLDLKYTIQWDWSLLNLDIGSENFVPFEKLKVIGCLHTCLTLLQKAVTCTILAY